MNIRFDSRQLGTRFLALLVFGMAALIAGCAGGSSGLPTQPIIGSGGPNGPTGFVLVTDDGNSTGGAPHGMQFIQIENNGSILPIPTATYLPIPASSDLDGQSITPDASAGAAIDGSNTVHFFNGIPQGHLNLLSATVDVTTFGGDGDAIGSLPGGDEVVVSADGNYSGPGPHNGTPQLALISGIGAGTPVLADLIPETDVRDGLVVSADGKVMLGRSSSGFDVWGITSVAPHPGSLGGTIAFNFAAPTAITSADPNFIDETSFTARAGMAISATDSSRGVVVGTKGGTPSVALITGMPSAPHLQAVQLNWPQVATRNARTRPEREGRGHPSVTTITGISSPSAVSITPDGKTAFVAGAGGIVGVTGVDTGTLAQVGTPVAPVVSVGATTCTFNNVATIAIMPDGKFLDALQDCGLAGPVGTGVLLVFPIQAGGTLGAPVEQLNNVIVPSNDQLLAH